MTNDDRGVTVRGILWLAQDYADCVEPIVDTYAALKAAVTKLAAERDEAERNVDLLSAALVECIPATCDHTNRQKLARRRWYCMDCGEAVPRGLIPPSNPP